MRQYDLGTGRSHYRSRVYIPRVARGFRRRSHDGDQFGRDALAPIRDVPAADVETRHREKTLPQDFEQTFSLALTENFIFPLLDDTVVGRMACVVQPRIELLPSRVLNGRRRFLWLVLQLDGVRRDVACGGVHDHGSLRPVGGSDATSREFTRRSEMSSFG